MPAYILSVFCKDQTGLIAAVTGSLYDHGANCGDTSFSVLGQGAEFSCVFSLQDDQELDDVEQALAQLPELADAEYDIKAFSLSTEHQAKATITHKIVINGGDHQGLLAQLSDAFIQFDANIVHLNCQQFAGKTGKEYHMDMSVFIPENRQEACLATVSNTASNLQLSCHIETA